ncbi:MAG: DUF3944 domain-containing protein [Campylobacter sp.]|nr:DUF3944 domain-containing protein [Campylobacter sp.]
MAYQFDEDLEFLRSDFLVHGDLNDLFNILVYDKDGDQRFTSDLKTSENFKRYPNQHKRYLDDILEELQRFGGNTFVNIVRGGGVQYKEILCEAADKMGAKYKSSQSTLEIELALIEKVIKESLEKMSADELKNLAEEYKLNIVNFSKDAVLAGLQGAIRLGGFTSYRIALTVANSVAKALLGSGLTLATNATLTTSMRFFAGPIGWAVTGIWTAVDIAGPAYRVTIPAVLQVASLRQLYFDRLKKQKDQENIKKGLSLDELFNKQPVNILITGKTGVGKSSTIEALFQREGKNSTAKIGVSAYPETQEITEYKIGSFTIHDTPGFGDGGENDERWRKMIVDKLSQTDNDGNILIDLVLVILDGGDRALGVEYNLINKTLIPNLRGHTKVIIALNKCDKAGTNRDFNYEKNEASEELLKKLDENVVTLKNRIKKDTNVDVDIVYYSAGEKYGENDKQPAYNLNKLLFYILENIPKKKRLGFVKFVENNDEFKKGDGKADYNAKIKRSFWETVKEFANDMVEKVKDVIEFFDRDDVKKVINKGIEIVSEVWKKPAKRTKKSIK